MANLSESSACLQPDSESDADIRLCDDPDACFRLCSDIEDAYKPYTESDVVVDDDEPKRRGLVRRLERAFGPSMKSPKRPPLPMRQLFAVAVLFQDSPSSMHDIWKWIRGHFQYYETLHHMMLQREFDIEYLDGTQILAEAWPPTVESGISVISIDGPDPLVDGYLREEYEAANFIVTSLDKLSNYLEDFVQLAFLLHAASPGSSRDGKGFDFLELTPELRAEVYRSVLCYPHGGLSIMSSGNQRDREMDSPVVYHRGIMCRPLQETLALLGVSRMIQAETIPIFFGENRFICRSQKELSLLLGGITHQRRKYLRDITLSYQPGRFDYRQPWQQTYCTLHDCFPLVQPMKNLRNLTIYTYDRDGSGQPHIGRHNDRSSYTARNDVEMPLDILDPLPNLTTVTFHGICPRKAAEWKAALAKSKPSVTVTYEETIEGPP